MTENDGFEHKLADNLVWRLHTVMSERGIRSAAELHRRLEPYGVAITSHQLSRIVTKLPARLNMDILAALMLVLDCSASELLRLADRPAVSAIPTPAQARSTRVRTRPDAAAQRAASAGARDVMEGAVSPSVRKARKSPAKASAKQATQPDSPLAPIDVLGPKVTSLASRRKPE